ncbi:MAG: hypothetical protein ICV53_16915 [Flavisolibacter sp.]|nr:hypothetical protein [Flavisolibacter sp.]
MVVLCTGNRADKSKALATELIGTSKLWGNKGYSSSQLQQTLGEGNMQVIPSLRATMENRLMSMADKWLLCKCSVMESLPDELKNNCEVEHSRPCSHQHFLVHLFCALRAYPYLPKKPSLNFEHQLLPLAA